MQGKEKSNRLLSLIMKTWRRPRLVVPRSRSFTTSCTAMLLIKRRRYRSWPNSDWDDMAPVQGYFAVYVGPDRTRFVIKTESVNHPLFRMLLEEAENEYGFDFVGPLTLPCEVAVFRRIMDALSTDYAAEDSVKEDEDRLGLLCRRALQF